MDGLLLRIKVPGPYEARNAKSFFSGHYQAYGMNVQAACDCDCRFVYVAVAAPGGSNDLAAYRKISLSAKIANLPLLKYVIGDNAYICTDTLLTPFGGSQKHDVDRSTYNFYVSQCRIRIEMAFGMLTNKWCIFKKPLQCSLRNASKVFMCAARLHNFCIDERIRIEGRTRPKRVEWANSGFYYSDLDELEEEFFDSSIMRGYLVQEISSKSLTRPLRNLQRNNNR